MLLKVIVGVYDVKQDSFLSAEDLTETPKTLTAPGKHSTSKCRGAKKGSPVKPQWKKTNAPSTPPARLHVFGRGCGEGPRGLLKVQRRLSTNVLEWRGQQVSLKLLVLNSEEGPSTWFGFCSPALLQLIRPSAESVPADPKHVWHKAVSSNENRLWESVISCLGRKGNQVAWGYVCVWLGESRESLCFNAEFWTHYLAGIQRLHEH